MEETTYSHFIHLSAGLRLASDREDILKFWPSGKKEGVELTGLPKGSLGTILENAGITLIGNEERAWHGGYEDRFWNPALLAGSGKNVSDWPRHDWSALGNAHRERKEENAALACSAAGFHLMAASRRLMHISEWYHQMLLYAHLKDMHEKTPFANSDRLNFMVDCHSFLIEAACARDQIARYIAIVITEQAKVTTFATLGKKSNRDQHPDGLREIVEKQFEGRMDELTLKHIGEYRDHIVHSGPITDLSKGCFETLNFDLGAEKLVLGVKFDILIWPKETSINKRFDALRTFHSMMRVLYEFGRAVITFAPVRPNPIMIASGGLVEIPTRRVPYP